MKYKKYPSYKDSGIEWLGEIPEHWNQRKIKHFAQTIPGGTPSTIEPEYWNGDIPWLPSGAVQNCIINEDRVIKFITKKGLYNSATKYISPNSTLIALTGATCANIGYLTFKSTANQSVVGIVTQKSTCDKYVFYSLISQKSQILVKRTGGAQAGINEQDVKDIFISYPPIQEQQQIANFLDKATAKIDTLIGKQTKQIELLKEKQQAVISHAVTKGINPNVPMKDSGVEWLGEIPEHWEVKKLGLITSKIGSGKTPRGGSEVYTDSGILFLRSQNIYDGGLFLDEVVYISEEINNEMLNTQIKDGDILLNVTGGSIGRTCLIPSNFQKANVNQHVCIIRLNTKKDRVFISYFMKSALIKSQIDGIQNGAAREGLNFEQISGFKIVLPPQNEQNEIVNYINYKSSKIDTLIEKSNKSIELLKEKRTALISACVTGKIDVRELV